MSMNQKESSRVESLESKLKDMKAELEKARIDSEEEKLSWT